jgi:cytochrome P450
MSSHSPLATASVTDTLKLLVDVLIPTVAKGAIIRRPAMVAIAERLDLDTRAVRRMQSLRRTYGADVLQLPVPFFPKAIVLGADEVNRILAQTPEPFATDTSLKHGALSHLQPKGSLISRGEERTARRQLNEQVLQSGIPVHHHAARFVDIVNEEAASLLERIGDVGTLAYDTFFDAWFRVVRRVTFGDDAHDDIDLTDMAFRLRKDGNWSFFKPQKKELRERFLSRLRERIASAPPESLAGMVWDIPNAEAGDLEHQVPQWLFAFDPAGMATARALALLASHPDAMERARQEVRDDTSSRQYLPFLRATVLEALRLWPTTPMVLRQTTERTPVGDDALKKETELLIYAPFFHRDDERLPFAHRFTPEIWEGGKTTSDWPLIPFSDGPGVCPGRNVVLLSTTAFLAAIIDRHDVTLTSHHQRTLNSEKPLPGTLNNFGLRFGLTPVA